MMAGKRGHERIERIVKALEDSEVDALVCAYPSNVLLLSGYWPVVGTSIAVATREGAVAVLVPEDEADLARAGWSDRQMTYSPSSMSSLSSPADNALEPLAELLSKVASSAGKIAYEDLPIFEESSYSATFRFHSVIPGMLTQVRPKAKIVGGHELIAGLRSRLTIDEVGHVRLGCEIAATAFEESVKHIRPGVGEPEVAASFASAMEARGMSHPNLQRAGAFVWCMSGARSADAGGAYARTSGRRLNAGDIVLVHCNSYVDGYFTDITRTYSIGGLDGRRSAMYEAIFRARAAALDAVDPGVSAASVDRAARRVLEEAGYGRYFTHGVGHSLGFTAISADFPPRLHPASSDRLEVGATFNIEPAIYIRGYGGIRHCDVVTLTSSGPEVLTEFQSEVASLTV